MLEHGVYLPSTGLTGFGHKPLFSDLNSPLWATLIEELKCEEALASSCVFLSSESIYFFPASKIERLYLLLRDFDVMFLFYLRDQAEVIQSGYLQKLKSRRQKTFLTHFKKDNRLLSPRVRNYLEIIGRFDAVFGAEAISIRVFDRNRFPEGNVVYDVIAALGLGPESRFPVSAHVQNNSLDVASAQLLNVFDSVCDDAEARTLLVDELLQCIQAHGGSGSQFLDEPALQFISGHYASSNKLLMERYAIEPCGSRLFAPSITANTRIDEPALLVNLSKQLSSPLWSGQVLEGLALDLITTSASGWGNSLPAGVWSLGSLSEISFRLPARMGYVRLQPLRLFFNGVYFGENNSTEVWCQDKFLGRIDLSNGHCDIPIEYVENHRQVDLELHHDFPQSPASLGKNDDSRLLAYRLVSLGYE